MSSSNIFNNYNKLLLQENYYNFKYNPYKRKNQKENIISLVNAIKFNNDNYEIKKSNLNDSLTTIEAIYNPYMLKLSDEDHYPFEQSNFNPRNKTARKRPNSKAIDIQRYSDCIKFSGNKKTNINAFSMSKANKNNNKIKIKKFIDTSSPKNRPLSYKKKCTYCNNLFQINKKVKKSKFEILDDHLNIYNNKNFGDSLSCFLYYINYFTSNEYENKKEDYYIDLKRNLNFNTDMISDFTKNLKKIKYKEIQRIEFDPSNLYVIQKPLIPTIRGKIFKNMKKRYRRPIRNVVTCHRATSSNVDFEKIKK